MALRTLAPLAVPGLVLLGMLAAYRSGADVFEALTAGARKGLAKAWNALERALVRKTAMDPREAAKALAAAKARKVQVRALDWKAAKALTRVLVKAARARKVLAMAPKKP